MQNSNPSPRPHTKLYYLHEENRLVTQDGTAIDGVYEIACNITPRGSEWDIRLRDVEIVRESTYVTEDDVKKAREGLESIEESLKESNGDI